MYWGANVRLDDYVIQAKIHGPHINPAPDELVEFLSNQLKHNVLKEENIALFFAEKIAAAYIDDDDAVFVTIDVLFTNGRTYGATEEILGKVPN